MDNYFMSVPRLPGFDSNMPSPLGLRTGIVSDWIASTKSPAPSGGAAANAPGGEKLSPEDAAYEAEARRWRLKHLAFAVDHQQRAYDLQFFHSRVIFWVVQGLVFVGVVLSCVQFALAARKKPGSDAAPPTEIEVSMKSIKISSAVLGVTILLMSLAFYYLYLLYVYPIVVVK